MVAFFDWDKERSEEELRVAVRRTVVAILTEQEEPCEEAQREQEEQTEAERREDFEDAADLGKVGSIAYRLRLPATLTDDVVIVPKGKISDEQEEFGEAMNDYFDIDLSDVQGLTLGQIVDLVIRLQPE